jgi:hypothetical protein
MRPHPSPHGLCGVVLAVGLVLQLPADAASATTKISPANEMKAVLAAGRAEGSVKWTVTASIGAFRVTEMTEAGNSLGVQQVAFADGTSKGDAVVQLVDRTAYVRGDVIALVGFLGFTTAEAPKVANKWIAITSGAPDYLTITAGLTVASTMDELAMTSSGLKLGPDRTVDGSKALSLEGQTVATPTAPASGQTLYVAATGKPLPIEAVQSAPVGKAVGKATVKILGWNAAIQVGVPSSALKFSASWLQPS